MARNKHLLLWSSLGVLALLLGAIYQENWGRTWRRLQRQVAAASAAGDDFDIHLRQIVIPAMSTTDRCVSCHVGMAPGEQGVPGDRVLGAHPRIPHDPGEFGCTVCHAGQGRATEAADAHGTVPHWPEPMIPAPYAEAGCGTCHTSIAVPPLDGLQRGAQLVERNDCLTCHALDGRGGTLRPGGAAGVTAPDLSAVGIRGVPATWYENHLQHREAAGSGPWQTSFARLDAPARATIDAFLRSRAGMPQLVEAKALFHSLGCRGCHKIAGVGGDDGPDLTRVGERDPGLLDFAHVGKEHSLAAWFKEHFRAPSQVVPGSQMPALGMSESVIDRLTLYMLSLRRPTLPENYWPKDRIRVMRLGAPEFASDGAALYGRFCAACHGLRGEGVRYSGMAAFPAIGSPGFLSLASDRLIADTIRHGRPGRRMPAWGRAEGGLTQDNITALVGYLRQLGSAPGQPPVTCQLPADPSVRITGDAKVGQTLYAAYCAACHGAQGQGGGEGTALNNPVLLTSANDQYLAETIRLGRPGTAMPTFGSASTTRATLSQPEIAAIVAYIRSWEKTR